MSGNPREHIRNKGFWNGGPTRNSPNDQTGGRSSGRPGVQKQDRTGVNTDMDFPAEMNPETRKSEAQ